MPDDTQVPAPERRFADSLKPGHCFICGAAGATSKEHVFPRWLLRDHDLFNVRLTLLNGSTKLYRGIVVPACEDCNTKHLAPLEKSISTAVRLGASAVRRAGSTDVALWMAKVYFGILRLESTLPHDRANPDSDPIASQAIMQSLSTMHDCLQHFRHESSFHGRPPWSLFVFDCLTYDDERDFDYKDAAIRYVRDPETGEVHGYLTAACAVRIGSVGMIATFGDRGYVEEILTDKVEPLVPIALHPIQFDELCARIFYQRGLFKGSNSTISLYHEADDAPTTILSPGTYALHWSLLFEPWDSRAFGPLYAYYMQHWGLDREQLVTANGLVLTFLEDDDDEPIVFPPDVLEQPGEGVLRIDGEDGAGENS